MGISIYNTSREIGETTYDLSYLCKSDKINKWSWNKPMNVNKVRRLTLADQRGADYGMDLYTFAHANDMLNALDANIESIWTYKTRTSPFRLTDFDNYNHTSEQWMQCEWQGNSTGGVGATLRFTISDLEEFVNFNYFSGVRSYMTFCLLIYSSSHSCYVYTIDTMVDIDLSSNSFVFKIPSYCVSGTTYKIRPCFTTASGVPQQRGECLPYDSTTMVGPWYAFPRESVLRLSVTQGGGGGTAQDTDFFNYIDVDIDNLYYNASVHVLSDLSFRLRIGLAQSTQSTLNTSISVYYNNGGSTKLCEYGVALSEDNIIYQYYNVNYNGTIVGGADVNPDHLTFIIIGTVTKNNVTQSKTWNITAENQNT